MDDAGAVQCGDAAGELDRVAEARRQRQARRPLYVNKELNRSNAFVAAWLPGTEAAGITDVIFRDANGDIHRDFQGKLSFSWPRSACQTPLNVGQPNYNPLFPYGFGLTYRHQHNHWLPVLDETPGPVAGCLE